LETGKLLPVYDLEVFPEFNLLAASCANGKVKFFDLETLVFKHDIDLSWLGRDLPGTYHCLRDAGFNISQSIKFLDDSESFAKEFGGDPELIEAAKNAMPSLDLLCCVRTSDPRVLAVGSDNGFVLLIDVRSYDLFKTLDVGGGRGVGLQWMCGGADGSIAALAKDGTLMKFESAFS
jgi:hypothetical protein